jgi:hypothetical protein
MLDHWNRLESPTEGFGNLSVKPIGTHWHALVGK